MMKGFVLENRAAGQLVLVSDADLSGYTGSRRSNFLSLRVAVEKKRFAFSMHSLIGTCSAMSDC